MTLSFQTTGAAGLLLCIGALTQCASAQEAPQPDACAQRVTGLGLDAITNQELGQLDGLFEFELQELDDEGNVVLPGTTGCRLTPANLRVAGILSRLDIDGDGVPDASPDTDGDGLPDNWELGGIETSNLVTDRVVFYPAPSPIVPGTPPTPIFTRRAVATSALSADTDGDGLSDFIEVFGLKFIDDNHNGILDSPQEWTDYNRDGLPSPGEHPVDQSNNITDVEGFLLRHDFDGFVFTDPTNPDTDGDGILDGEDSDPLINPRAFGIAERIIVRFQAQGNADIDQDGLGNGMDMGNDLLVSEAPDLPSHQVIDNPANLRNLLGLFREDLLKEGVVPESTIEDLLGADWDGNGLWRTTDVREWSIVIDPDSDESRPPDGFFTLDDGTLLYSAQKLADSDLTEDEVDTGRRSLTAIVNDPSFNRYAERGVGLGWQRVLQPPSTNAFIPDRRVWAILYSWRMPGFDIDGDGFIGVPNLTATSEGTEGNAMVALHRASSAGRSLLSDSVDLLSEDDGDFPFNDRIPIGEPEVQSPELNGVIEVDNIVKALGNLGCGAVGAGVLGMMALGLIVPMWCRRR